jgi:ATPase subunit of ABC transporter with duplicated ATPase domains
MSAVCAQELGFSHTDRVPLFNRVTLRLTEGWYGLVGANGSGKTTFARLVLGELRPTSGRLWVQPNDAKLLLCAQSIESLPDGLMQFAEANDRESCRWRGLLRLDPGALTRWATLSPGERKRWQLAAAIAAAPDVLIVDEPTNHLDAEAREVIGDALRRFAGVGLLVSHDRELLAALTARTLRIHHGEIELFAQSYAQAKVEWESTSERALELRQQQVEQKHRLEKRINVAKHEKQAAHANRSARHRMKDRHDHDASSIMADGRAANGEASLSRKLGNMRAELVRVSGQIPAFIEDKTACRNVFVDYQPAASPRVLGIDGEDLHVGGQILLRDVRVTLGRTARVHLTGPNGCGKSTLLRALLGHAGAKREQLLWLPQELDREEVRRLQATIEELPRLERGRLMTLLVALGVEPEHLLASESPSPGEARKLKLAFGLATHATALVLDEPTNHLDLPSTERLEVALAAFPGAILLVSHDAQFAAACSNATWEIQGQRVCAR